MSYRNVLGVSNKTNSPATLGELDRYPVMLNCYVQMIKYWHHIKTAYLKDSLVYKVINYMENNDKQEQYKWLSTVKFILELCELDYVWKDPDKIVNSNLITKCFNSLVERYINFWQDRNSNDESCCPKRLQPSGGNKLRTYKLLKSDYKMELYLYFIRDHEIRRNLAKLRCSNHSLLIESGRYLKLEIADRVCKRCNRVEDETHFLIECSLYTFTRQKFYKDNNISVENESKETFITLMKTKDKQLLVNLANFRLFRNKKGTSGLININFN